MVVVATGTGVLHIIDPFPVVAPMVLPITSKLPANRKIPSQGLSSLLLKSILAIVLFEILVAFMVPA